ncbi:inositol monophosphatase family protein [Candidatus Synechococcus calcipolaris G9]|uniref:Inositol monophosphatase family protein n=1 Tax=Candidatus Synechococcus calcipolaris G9 TaxID=1497997 RepID=A0ABT6F2N9_9SYNE|nr:inositol monophosphatase family protein [Candidatus Synechococcus calcipolaris]MDG2992126.1 inositol monophosphatase family protein [Candidatus Synechococcus calcipolaris G9]
MEHHFWSTVLDLCGKTTTVVGSHLMGEAGQSFTEQKSDGSLVTVADRWADQELRRGIAAIFPDHGLLSEEGAHHFPETDWCWIIDPIDGTTNFSHGLPIWCIALGLLYRGMPVFGYVAVPPLHQVFHGFYQAPGHGDGAYLNQQPIQCQPGVPSHQAFFSLCARSISLLKRPFPCKIRMLGSASYNFLTVAAGYTLGAVERTPMIWDIAPAWPIVHGAGAHWASLESLDKLDPLSVKNVPDIFPLKFGESYGDRSYHTLVSASSELAAIFLPYIRDSVTQ